MVLNSTVKHYFFRPRIVGDKILYGIVRKKFLELAIELCRQGTDLSLNNITRILNLYHYSKRHIKSIDFFECLFCFLPGHIPRPQTEEMPWPDLRSLHRIWSGTFLFIFRVRISAHVVSSYILSLILSGSCTRFFSGSYSSRHSSLLTETSYAVLVSVSVSDSFFT